MGKRTLVVLVALLIPAVFLCGCVGSQDAKNSAMGSANDVKQNIENLFGIELEVQQEVGKELVTEKMPAEVENSAKPTKVIIGGSKIELKTADKLTVGTQVDRVVRDYLWYNSSFDANVPADRVPENISQVVPYMEGARTQEMMKWANVLVLPLTPSIAIKKDNGYYYGSDGQGNFIFEICPGKTTYPTCEYFNESGNEYVVMHDTHGFNAVAEQAYLNKDRVSLAIACMDMPAKADAALYLAQNEIQCYAPCDRFTNELMGYKQKYNMSMEILGSAPIRQTEYGAVIGDCPMEIVLDEPIVVQYTDREYPDQYCDTPSRYFRKLQEVYNVNLIVTEVSANVGETSKLVKEARNQSARVIGARIFSEDDYWPLKLWLEEDKSNRIVLCHSAAYEFGIQLFREFPEQTSFGDLNPEFA